MLEMKLINYTFVFMLGKTLLIFNPWNYSSVRNKCYNKVIVIYTKMLISVLLLNLPCAKCLQNDHFDHSFEEKDNWPVTNIFMYSDLKYWLYISVFANVHLHVYNVWIFLFTYSHLKFWRQIISIKWSIIENYS